MKKTFLLVVAVGVLGFVIGRVTAPQSSKSDLRAVVDCYDKQGNLVRDPFWEKLGGVTVGCAPDQIARIHETNAPVHIDPH